MLPADRTSPVHVLCNVQRAHEHSLGRLSRCPNRHMSKSTTCTLFVSSNLIPSRPHVCKTLIARSLTLTHSHPVADNVTTASGSFSANSFIASSCSVFLVIFAASTCKSSVCVCLPTTWKRHDVINHSNVVAFVLCCNSCPLCFSRNSTGAGCSICKLPDLSLLSVLTSPFCWSICTPSGFASISCGGTACDIELLPPPC